MIIECPSCQARYIVPVGAFASGGRKVRCARCRNEWLAALPLSIDVYAAPAEITRAALTAPFAEGVHSPPPIPESPDDQPANVVGNLPALIKKFSVTLFCSNLIFRRLKRSILSLSLKE